jgi:hypothetical protein
MPHGIALSGVRHISQNTMLQIVRKVGLLPSVFVYWLVSTGWRAALTWTSYRIRTAVGIPEPSTIQIKPHLAQFPVTARLGGSSDIDVFHQIFQADEYACIRDIETPRFILDLGANVGYSSAYLLSCFPNAKVLAVEPDPANFELCCRNLAVYGDRAKVVLGAAWSKRTNLKLSRGAHGRTARHHRRGREHVAAHS